MTLYKWVKIYYLTDRSTFYNYLCCNNKSSTFNLSLFIDTVFLQDYGNIEQADVGKKFAIYF